MKYQRKDKIVFGMILAVWFFAWAFAIQSEPDKAVTNMLDSYGVEPILWTVLFLLAGLGACVHTIMNWRWNIIILLPYIMHTSSLIFLKVESDFAPLESIVIRLVLLILVLLEFSKDGSLDLWKWNS